MIEEEEPTIVPVEQGQTIRQYAKAYKLRVRYTNGKTRNKIYAVNNDEDFQTLADKLHIYQMQPNVVEAVLLRTRLPNKFADPLRHKQRTERPQSLLKVHESGAFFTPAEMELD